MQTFRRYRYRLDPTNDQVKTFLQWAGCARAVRNAGLEQRQIAWKLLRQTVRYEAQCAQLPDLKRAYPWLSEPHSDVLICALRDLDRAFQSFYAGRTRHPRFRSRCRRQERFRVMDRGRRGAIQIRRTGKNVGRVRVPKLGLVRFRWSRPPVGRIMSATVSRDALGWHLTLCCEQPLDAPERISEPVIGIDRGIVAAIATSSGELHRTPTLTPGETQRLRRLRRRAGRQETLRRKAPPSKRRRSNRHKRTLERAARLEARAARIGHDFRHQVSTRIAARNGTVVLEHLSVGALTRSARGNVDRPGDRVAAKASLNRSIRANGWGEFRAMIDYKLAARGGRLLEVPAAFTSQRCAVCGLIDPCSRESRDRFRCVYCGNADHADINAAKNIRAAGLAVPARGALCEGKATKREPAPRSLSSFEGDW